MRYPPLKFRQSLITSEKPGYFSGKFWWAPTTIGFNIFCWNFVQLSYLSLSSKGVQNFFILFRSWVIENPGVCECVDTSPFILANNSRSKQNETNLEHPFEHVGK